MSLVVYGFCGANCKHQVLTVDQTADLIQQMIANGGQIPENYIPKTAVNEIINQCTGEALKVFIGTQALWDSWTGDKSDVLFMATDDMTISDIEEAINKLQVTAAELQEKTTTLQGNIENVSNGLNLEMNNRIEQVNSLSQRMSNEETARMQADNALSDRLEVLEGSNWIDVTLAESEAGVPIICDGESYEIEIFREGGGIFKICGTIVPTGGGSSHLIATVVGQVLSSVFTITEYFAKTYNNKLNVLQRHTGITSLTDNTIEQSEDSYVAFRYRRIR